MTGLELPEKIGELGVTFCMPVPSPNGHETHLANPRELITFVEDPTVIYARRYGVSKAQWATWVSDGFSVHCAGLSSKGKPRKKIIKGGHNVSPKQWVQLQGEYCSAHGEGNRFPL